MARPMTAVGPIAVAAPTAASGRTRPKPDIDYDSLGAGKLTLAVGADTELSHFWALCRRPRK